jgi:hypothetical protein
MLSRPYDIGATFLQDRRRTHRARRRTDHVLALATTARLRSPRSRTDALGSRLWLRNSGVRGCGHRCNPAWQPGLARIHAEVSGHNSEEDSPWTVMLSSTRPNMEASSSIRSRTCRARNRTTSTLPGYLAPQWPRGSGRCSARSTSLISPCFLKGYGVGGDPCKRFPMSGYEVPSCA